MISDDNHNQGENTLGTQEERETQEDMETQEERETQEDMETQESDTQETTGAQESNTEASRKRKRRNAVPKYSLNEKFL